MRTPNVISNTLVRFLSLMLPNHYIVTVIIALYKNSRNVASVTEFKAFQVIQYLRLDFLLLPSKTEVDKAGLDAATRRSRKR